jgi:hypothetical protein
MVAGHILVVWENGVMGCNAVKFGEILTFERNISTPSSGSEIEPRKKPAEASDGSSETSGSVLTTLRYNPEHRTKYCSGEI